MSSRNTMADFLGIMSGLLINPVFVSRFYSAYGGAEGSTEAVNQTIIGISVSCLQISAAIGALIAGRCVERRVQPDLVV